MSETIVMSPQILGRMWQKIDITSSCWNWKPKHVSGYGIFSIGRKGTFRVHRLIYELLVEHIPEGMVIDHLCRNKRCCNPAHLQIVTEKENIQRGKSGFFNREKTHCPRGHEYTPDNTYYHTQRLGRFCKECNALRGRIRRAKKCVQK